MQSTMLKRYRQNNSKGAMKFIQIYRHNILLDEVTASLKPGAIVAHLT